MRADGGAWDVTYTHLGRAPDLARLPWRDPSAAFYVGLLPPNGPSGVTFAISEMAERANFCVSFHHSVIDAQQVETIRLQRQSLQPEPESIALLRFPVVERIAPQLPVLGEIIRRHSGYRRRLAERQGDAGAGRLQSRQMVLPLPQRVASRRRHGPGHALQGSRLIGGDPAATAPLYLKPPPRP